MRFRLRLLATTLVCHGVLGILPVKAEDSIPTPAQPVVSEGAVPAEEGTAEYPPEPGIPDTETADTAAADSATAEAGTPADTSSEAPDPAGQDVTHPSAAPADSEQIDFADRSRLWVVHRLDTLSGSLDTFFMNMLFDEQLVDQDIRGNTARISASS